MKTTLLSLKAFFTICLLCLVGGVNVMAQDTETVDFTKQGYTDKNEVSTYLGTDFQITFSKGSYTSLPKYYNTSNSTPSALRFYSGNTMTFSSSTKKIKEISFTYNSSKPGTKYKVSSGTYEYQQNTGKGTWTSEEGGVNSVKFDNTARGQYQIKNVTVTFVSDATAPKAPTINPASQTFSEPFVANISCSDAAAKIYYTIDGSDPRTSTTRSEYTTGVEISAATTALKAVAIKNGIASEVAEAVYTYVGPTYPYTIWSEDWSSFNTDDTQQPAEGVNATYSYVPAQTKIYNDVLAGGERPELLISKKSNSGSFTVKIKDLKGHSGTFQFTFFANKEDFEVETIGGQLIGERTKEKLNNNGKTNDKYTYTIAVPQNTKNLELTIKTTDNNTNVRVDNLGLYAKLNILGTGTFTLTTAQYGTYYTEDAFVMPEGVTGYTITSEDGKTLKFNEAYVAGAIVPAKTALVLKATEELTANKEYTYTIVNSDAVAPADNLLHGSVAEAMTSVKDATAYYKLALGEEGLGFYYGAENGGEFKNGAHKAYLAVTTEGMSKIRGFSFDSMTTGINHVVANAEHAKTTVIYDLNGRRVNSLNAAAKGVYIVNGKKVIVK